MQLTETTAQELIKCIEQLAQSQQKTWLSTLTEKSTTLLTTQDIVQLTNFSYHHTYTDIVARPDFSRPIKISKASKGRECRRWIAGEVISYLKSLSKI
ncbi:hypothetical protein [Kingella kingae]|uniref:hypothetical protein n=1 Tax=Kingella kingae TaxID=504 RepID=UPI0003FE1ECB|nr:hypothetical protein [Kingella kingae]